MSLYQIAGYDSRSMIITSQVLIYQVEGDK